MTSTHRTLLSITATLALLLSPTAHADEFEGLPMPGRPAPPIVAAKWLRGDPVTQWKPGHLYVVDLWSTWCAPCLATIPLLSRVQARHPKDVTIVGMNVWEFNPEYIPEFVKARGDSMAFTVATDSLPPGKDPNLGMTAVAYLGTSDMASIPKTFLIDGTGRITWIGLPEGVEDVIEKAQAGTWDAGAFAKRYEADMRVELRHRHLVAPIQAAINAEHWDLAFRLSEDAAASDPSFAPRLAHHGFVLLAMEILRRNDASAADLNTARRAAQRAIDLDPEAGWDLYHIAAQAAARAHDGAAARNYMKEAIRLAPDEERPDLEAELEDIDGRN